ncbi:MAG: hypothetical protein AAGC55_08780 [Myxococcota bacterium]
MTHDNRTIVWLAAALAATLGISTGCDDSMDSGDSSGDGLTVRGTFIDLGTDEPMTEPVNMTVVTADGSTLNSVEIIVDGSQFELRGVPADTRLHFRAFSPLYLDTFNEWTGDETDLDEHRIYVASFVYIEQTALSFGLSQQLNKAVLIGTVVDTSGNPIPDVRGSSIAVNSDPLRSGPYLFDDDMLPDMNRLTTSNSGGFVFFNIPAQPFEMVALPGSDYSMFTEETPTAALSVNLFDVVVTDQPAAEDP